MTDNSKEIELLEKFLLDNPELQKLEGMLSQFNVFETLNIVNAEVRHSNVLAWLLNPAENHGLGNFFLSQFLKHFISENKYSLSDQISLFDLDNFNLYDVEIRREWKSIDILILINEDRTNIAITIENKIRSSEHSNQLTRYREIIEKEFPNHIKLFIYLTPDKIPPEDQTWKPFSYSTIADIMDYILDFKRDSLNVNAFTFLSQYGIMLRRYIVGNSEIERICQQIYKKHHKALDLIFQYRPNIELEIIEYLHSLIKNTKDIILDSSAKTLIRFSTTLFDNMFEKLGEGWVESNRIFLFEFIVYNKRVNLNLYIGLGSEDYRKKILDACLLAPDIFTSSKAKKWPNVFKKQFLDNKDFESPFDDEAVEFEDLREKIDNRWQDFIKNDLKNIQDHFKKIEFGAKP